MSDNTCRSASQHLLVVGMHQSQDDDASLEFQTLLRRLNLGSPDSQNSENASSLDLSSYYSLSDSLSSSSNFSGSSFEPSNLNELDSDTKSCYSPLTKTCTSVPPFRWSGPGNWRIKPTEVFFDEGVVTKRRYSTTKKGQWRGNDVFVTHLTLPLSSQHLDKIHSYVTLRLTIRHPNLILFMGACLHPDNVFFVTEYLPGGCVRDILSLSSLSLERRMNIAQGVAQGLAWLHGCQHALVHGNLTSRCLWLDNNLVVKIGEFGLASLPLRHHIFSKQFRWHLSPRLLQGEDPLPCDDVYAYAFLLWELITGSQPPIPEGSVDELKVALLMQRLKLPLPKALPTKMKTLITLCWSHDERKRPNMSTVLSMLDEAVVAVLLPDQYARKFWTSEFSSQFSVEWRSFVESVTKFFDIDPSLNIQHERYRGLMFFLALLKNISGYTSRSEGKLHIQDLSRFLQWFAPFDSAVLDRVTTVVGQRWFHGFLDKEEAVKRVKAASRHEGVFLVRFSTSIPGAYAVTAWLQSSVKHFIVSSKSDETGVWFYSSNVCCRSLFEVIKQFQSSGLGRPLQGPFYSIWDTTTLPMSYGYVVPQLCQ